MSVPAPPRKTVAVSIGGVTVGGSAPVVVQSMTNTDTADVEATVRQVIDLARAGSELWVVNAASNGKEKILNDTKERPGLQNSRRFVDPCVT